MEHKKVDVGHVTETILHMRDCMADIIQNFKTNPDDTKVELSELLKKYNSVSASFNEPLLLSPRRDIKGKISLFCFKKVLSTEEILMRMSETLCVPASMKEAASFYGLNMFYEPPADYDLVILGSVNVEMGVNIFPSMRYKRQNGILICDVKKSLEEDKWNYNKHLFLGVDGTTKYKRAV